MLRTASLAYWFQNNTNRKLHVSWTADALAGTTWTVDVKNGFSISIFNHVLWFPEAAPICTCNVVDVIITLRYIMWLSFGLQISPADIMKQWKQRVVRERIPQPTRIWSGSGLRIWIPDPDYFSNFTATSLAKEGHICDKIFMKIRSLSPEI